MTTVEYICYCFAGLLGVVMFALGLLIWREQRVARRRRVSSQFCVCGIVAMSAAVAEATGEQSLAMSLVLASMAMYSFLLTEISFELMLKRWANITLTLALAGVTAFLVALALIRIGEPDRAMEEWEPTFFTGGWILAMIVSHSVVTVGCLFEAREMP